MPSSSSNVVLCPKTAPPYCASFCSSGSPMVRRVSLRAASRVSYSSFAAAARRLIDSSSRRRRVRSASASASSSLTPETDLSSPVSPPRRTRNFICSSRSPSKYDSAPISDASASSAPRSTNASRARSAATRASANVASAPANRSARSSSFSRARASVRASTARRTSSTLACSSACFRCNSWRAGRALIDCAACMAASYSTPAVRSASRASSRMRCASASSSGKSEATKAASEEAATPSPVPSSVPVGPSSPSPSPLPDQPAIMSARMPG